MSSHLSSRAEKKIGAFCGWPRAPRRECRPGDGNTALRFGNTRSGDASNNLIWLYRIGRNDLCGSREVLIIDHQCVRLPKLSTYLCERLTKTGARVFLGKIQFWFVVK